MGIGGNMAGYQPINIKSNEAGLIQSREEFLLPVDAYPQLINAYVWRERILRKLGYRLIGRLQRQLNQVIINPVGVGQSSLTLNNILVNYFGISGEPYATIAPNSLTITFSAPDTATFTDNGQGGFTATGNGKATGSTINYVTGNIVLQFNNPTIGGGTVTAVTFYNPNLPVMGIRTKENNSALVNTTVFFDQKYAYVYDGGTLQFVEFVPNPSTTWSGTDYEFFWTTNYWISNLNNKIFWATNYSLTGDPIRYTDGQALSTWYNFAPQIDATPNYLWQCLALLPFRGRLVAFNTAEGPNLLGSLRYTNRIRWAAIGNPFTTVSAIVTTVNANAWRDDIRGQGGFLDIPTNEDIVSVGFVRDNLVIYCESSSWQLRYTGRSIAPFQIEKVNSEIGSSGTFSSVQFDTSLLCMGNRGIVECDSFKSDVIDIKIPDFVFNQKGNQNFGNARVHGIRDFENRLVYWTYVNSNTNSTFPNSRLVYNYENDSWAIFTDSLTTLGIFQTVAAPRWIDITVPWIEYPFNWIFEQVQEQVISGGNQQGFVFELDCRTTNESGLYIYNITGNTTTSTRITSQNHNLQTGDVIQITGIPSTDPFYSLNNGIFGIVYVDPNNFDLNVFDALTGQFSAPQLNSPATFLGIGYISVRDNFSIVSKKFNFMDEGQNIQMGYLDILMSASEQENPGAITLNVYLDYDDNEPVNNYLQNTDTFFNTIIPTYSDVLCNVNSDKFWQRVICPVRGNFITIEYTFSNAQMNGIEQELKVQIDAQVIWVRRAGRMTQF